MRGEADFYRSLRAIAPVWHGHRPRVQRRRSVASASNRRWAMDVTHIPCGRDGWGCLCAVIDCHDRDIVGWEYALRGRAREAERALENARLSRLELHVRAVQFL